MQTHNILVIGAAGQLGAELTPALARRFGAAHIVAADLRPGLTSTTPSEIQYERLDVRDAARLQELVKKYEIGTIYHLAALLSATGEQQPQLAWEINMQGLLNVLEVAVALQVKQLFWPSSIAVFGPNTPRVNTPQHCIMDPSSMYGITKLAGERLCAYYHSKYGLDVRSLRYPGLISYSTAPGGGTTDYAVHIFHEVVKGNNYTSFLNAETRLPMMYMPDAVYATLQLMDAPAAQIKVHSSYNLAAMSFTPAEIGAEIQQHYPNFKLGYAPDYRQQIADSWPQSIDDSEARADWGWQPKYDLARMTEDMLRQLAPVGV